MSVSLTNTTHRMQIFHLLHGQYCAALGTCACVVLPGRESRRVAASFTLPARGTAAGLADAVLELAQVERAIRAGAIKVQRQPVRNTQRKRRTRRRAETNKRGNS